MPECPNVLIPCPLCETEVKRSDVDEHIRDQCTHAAVECDFRPIGCTVCLTRRELSSLLEEYRDFHSELLKEIIAGLKGIHMLNDLVKNISGKMNGMREVIQSLRWQLDIAQHINESRQEEFNEERQENVYRIHALKEEKKRLWKVIWFLVIVLCIVLYIVHVLYYSPSVYIFVLSLLIDNKYT